MRKCHHYKFAAGHPLQHTLETGEEDVVEQFELALSQNIIDFIDNNKDKIIIRIRQGLGSAGESIEDKDIPEKYFDVIENYVMNRLRFDEADLRHLFAAYEGEIKGLIDDSIKEEISDKTSVPVSPLQVRGSDKPKEVARILRLIAGEIDKARHPSISAVARDLKSILHNLLR